MSWLSIPLPNPFKSLHFSQEEEDDEQQQQQQQPPQPPQNDAVSSSSGGGGPHSSRTMEGIKSDLEEIKGSFVNSLSLLSSHTHTSVSQLSKLASNFLNFNDHDYNNNNNINTNVTKNDDVNDDDDDDDGNNNDDDDYDDDDEGDGDGVGISDEVIEFANQISNRPELWTEFPLSLDHHHEFDMSEAQYEHASTIEQLVPSLGDLRSRISGDKSDKHFWMIYFILLLPRLNEEDVELLSTPEIIEARETLLKMLQAKKSEKINSEDPKLDSSSDSDEEVHHTSINNNQCAEMTSENSNASRSIERSDSNNTKRILGAEDGRSFTSNFPNQPDVKPENPNVGLVTEEQEENLATAGTSAVTSKRFQSEDDVSFSDLEDDDNDLPNRQSSSGPSPLTRTSSPEASNDWVRLNENVEAGGNRVKGQSSLRERDSEGEDSTGWLTVDDFDP